MKHAAPIAAAAGAGVIGVGLMIIRSRKTGSSPIDLVKPSTPEEALPPVTVSPVEANLHKAMRPVILDAFKLAGYPNPTSAQVQYMSAVAWLETRDGTGWPANMASAHNWGAVQCDLKTAAPGTCIPHKDHYSDGTEFAVGFRAYPSDVEGAADVVKHIFKHRPETAKALAEASPTAYRASYAMRREKYYGGICTTPMKSGKTTQAQAADSFAHPDANDGTRACAEDTIGQHAKIVMRNAQAIAQTLGEPLALRLGTYEDADAWWRKNNPPKGVSGSGASPWPIEDCFGTESDLERAQKRPGPVKVAPRGRKRPPVLSLVRTSRTGTVRA